MSLATGRLSDALQTLVDSRLDTIDRMLLGRVPRQDRLAIVREVESQIFDLLPERDAGELSREDVLAVLARLDPPEAYLPEDDEEGPALSSIHLPAPADVSARPWRRGDPRAARASGILGLVALVLVILSPLVYMLAMLFQSEILLFGLGGMVLLMVVVTGLLGLVLGVYSRVRGAWAVTGVVTSALALFSSLLGTAALLLLLAG
jgi:hypothetical protein